MTQSTDPIDTFRQEANELLEQFEQAMLDLEQTPDDRDVIDGAFRALHTIKGSGAMFGFERVACFTHGFETAFDQVRKGKSPVTKELIKLALEAQDYIRHLIQTPHSADHKEGERIMEGLCQIFGHDNPCQMPVQSASAESTSAPVAEKSTSEKADEKASTPVWRIRFRLSRNAMAMGTNPLLLLDELCSLGSATVVALMDDVPPLADMEPDTLYAGWDVVLTTTHPRQAIDDVFMFVIDDMDLKVEAVKSDAESPKKLGEILVDRGDVKPADVSNALAAQPKLGTLLVQSGAVSESKVAAALAEQRHTKQEADKEAAKANSSVRVPAERLDELMDRVGELVITQARLTQLAAMNSDLNIKALAEELERLTAGLRDVTMGIRMVPIGSLFGRFRRLVHDLSRDLGKSVELVTVGEDTELDKTVIERLADPLVHLIRNSIDHGLEGPADRVAAGKSEAGTVRLSASHAGAQVLITITDDGRGLNRDRIRAKAEEQGLLAAGAKIPDAELFQLLFHPGFSTAEKVSAVSGRGVGMDVVKRTIEALRGTIDMTTEAGKGTTITLRLPLTLAIIDSLLVRVGSGRYAIPLSAVEECVELSPEDDLRSTGRSFLNIRGELVPFLRLRDVFQTGTPPDLYQKVVIVTMGDLRVGLAVDQLLGNHQTVIKSLSKLHAHVEMFSGATILGDGSVALILDVAHLVDMGQTQDEPLKVAS